jgi:hypothetical protein
LEAKLGRTGGYRVAEPSLKTQSGGVSEVSFRTLLPG